MSEMQVDAAIRFKVAEGLSTQEAYELAKKMFGKEPDEVDAYNDEIEYFRYDADHNEGFTTNTPEGVLYIDYMFEVDEYEFDLNITQEDISAIVHDAALKFGSTLKDNWKIKVFYYYNGGCAGLMEVE